MKGKIVTFYSYKGGVGRSMALANIAVILSKWNFKVLILDWDFEAPGLEYYFKDYCKLQEIQESIGVIDILESYVSNKKINWKDAKNTIQFQENGDSFSLDLITSGKKDNRYFEKVQNFEYSRFYTFHKGGTQIEELRNEWRDGYDFVFIDSRTGISDYGGICTVQLPDYLLMFFTATDQGLDGIVNVSKNVDIALKKMPVDRYGIIKIPIPTRFDMRSENKLAHEWLDKFAFKLFPIIDPWFEVTENGSMFEEFREFLSQIYIPPVPIFGFGERLPVIEEGTKIKDSIGYSYETIAAILGSNLNEASYLQSNRNFLVKEASSKKEKAVNIDFFLSFHEEDKEMALMIENYLIKNKFTVFKSNYFGLISNHNFLDTVNGAINSANHFILVAGSIKSIESSYVLNEWRTFLFRKYNGFEGSFILVVNEKVKTVDLPTNLNNFNLVTFNSKTMSSIINIVRNGKNNQNRKSIQIYSTINSSIKADLQETVSFLSNHMKKFSFEYIEVLNISNTNLNKLSNCDYFVGIYDLKVLKFSHKSILDRACLELERAIFESKIIYTYFINYEADNSMNYYETNNLVNKGINVLKRNAREYSLIRENLNFDNLQKYLALDLGRLSI